MTTQQGPDKTVQTEARWSAWFRPGQRQLWAKIGDADDLATAWKLVLTYPLSGDRTVSSLGRNPNDDRKRLR